MKKLLLLTAIILAATLGMIGCAEETITELAFKNKSTEAINEIVWVADDVEWTKGTDGYPTDDVTEYREIDNFTSQVTCKVWSNTFTDFVEADVSIQGLSDTITIGSNAEGASIILELEATPSK
jgi:hypothetical protein